jgi:diacylglycerol kinase (ATP)
LKKGSSLDKIAVIAHSGKSLGGGQEELRLILKDAEISQPLWYEATKSAQIPKYARQAIAEGAKLIFVWGGDGSVQKCIDTVAGSDVAIAILPAGTANLLAKNLGIPQNLKMAVRIGLQGNRKSIDTGTLNGEHFAVMAGAGIDARMIRDASSSLKARVGRAAYLWSGAKNLSKSPIEVTVEVDDHGFYKGKISCILVGNMNKVFAGVEVFDDSRPNDGLLEFGVITAKNPLQWLRTIGRVIFGRSDNSPFVETTRGKSMKVTFDSETPYELDGGIRKATSKLKIKVHPSSVTICVPATNQELARNGIQSR